MQRSSPLVRIVPIKTAYRSKQKVIAAKHLSCDAMKSLLILSFLVAAASAHLCLLEPHQRGSMQDLNTAGETGYN